MKEEAASQIDSNNKDESSQPSKNSKFTMIEALSASGLRSCRYALECKGIDSIIANDLSVTAVDEIKQNIEYNEVSNIVTANCDDAIDLLTRHRSKAM